MKNLLFILLFFPVFAYSQGVASTKEMEDNTILIAPQTAYVKGTNTLNGAVNLKRIRLDSLSAFISKGVATLIVNKADLSYVNTQLANLGISQANAKMDSSRVLTLLTLKANVTALNSKVETTTFNTALSSKANSTDLAAKENTTDVNAKLGFKAPSLDPIFTGTVNANNLLLNTSSSIYWKDMFSATPARYINVSEGAMAIGDIDNVGLSQNLYFGKYGHVFTVNNAEKIRINGMGYLGIGTASPTSKLQVKDGDVELETINTGIIIKSPNGTRFRLTISDSGNIIATSL